MNLIEIYISVFQVFTADINLFHLRSSGTDILESQYKRYLDYSKFSSVLKGINMIVFRS